MSIDHFLLTRFYVRIKPGAALPGDEWLRSRLPFFESVCLPSVLDQNSSDFRWLVFVDAGGPPWVSEYLLGKLPSNAEIVPVHGVCDGPEISKAVGSRVSAHRVITSRVDSDDALGSRYISSVRAALAGRERLFLNFTHGYQLSRRRLLRYSHPSNAFISLVEPRSEAPMTVFVDWHDRVSRHARIVQDDGYRAWVQNCHGANVRNSERGVRADHQKALRDDFRFLELRPQKRAEYLWDVSRTASRAILAVLRKPTRILRLLGRR